MTFIDGVEVQDTDDPISMLVGGGNRAFKQAMPRLSRLSRSLNDHHLEIQLADPYPGRAVMREREAENMGIRVTGHQERVEDFMKTVPDGTPVVLHVDNAGTIADANENAIGRDMPVQTYSMFVTPDEKLHAFMGSASTDDEKRALALLFRKMDEVSANRGTEFVFGEEGLPQHRFLEPRFREYFANDLQETLPKLKAGLKPQIPFQEYDGSTLKPVFIHLEESGRAEPQALAQTLLKNPVYAVLPGEHVLIAEISGTEEGVRFITARIRKTDRRISMNGVSLFSSEGFAEAEQQKLERAIRKAERQTVTRSWPVTMCE